MTGKQLFIVTAYYGSGHGDAATNFCASPTLEKALKAAARGKEGGFRFSQLDHGIGITCLEEGRIYEKREFAWYEDVSLPTDHPSVVFFRWSNGRFTPEFHKDTPARFGMSTFHPL